MGLHIFVRNKEDFLHCSRLRGFHRLCNGHIVLLELATEGIRLSSMMWIKYAFLGFSSRLSQECKGAAKGACLKSSPVVSIAT
jgi:hypothetical protein